MLVLAWCSRASLDLGHNPILVGQGELHGDARRHAEVLSAHLMEDGIVILDPFPVLSTQGSVPHAQ